ncbi:hypothetical protein B0H14DRAFT_2559223 [Mycena olivaceomarginata]|nr:hypothetical protein B0H14DRAFT_2559223 [Mycena olivaceomarginata]
MQVHCADQITRIFRSIWPQQGCTGPNLAVIYRCVAFVFCVYPLPLCDGLGRRGEEPKPWKKGQGKGKSKSKEYRIRGVLKAPRATIYSIEALYIQVESSEHSHLRAPSAVGLLLNPPARVDVRRQRASLNPHPAFPLRRRGHPWRPQRPLIFNLRLVADLELGAGFVQTPTNSPPCAHCSASTWAASGTSLPPPRSGTALWGLRGLPSGVLQQGIAAVISLELVLTVHVGRRSLFWTASDIGVSGACLCALLPESRILVKTYAVLSPSYCPLFHPTLPVVEEHTLTLSCTQARLTAESHAVVSEAQKMRETGAMPKKHWALFLSHGSQDLYGFNPHTANDLGIGLLAILDLTSVGLVSRRPPPSLRLVPPVILLPSVSSIPHPPSLHLVPPLILPPCHRLRWRDLRRRLRRVDLPVPGATDYHCRLHAPHRGLHPVQLQRPRAGGELCAVWRAGRVGYYPHPPRGDSAARVPRHFPGITYQLGNMVFSVSTQIEASERRRPARPTRLAEPFADRVSSLSLSYSYTGRRRSRAWWCPTTKGTTARTWRSAAQRSTRADDAWIDDDGVHYQTGRVAHDRDVEAGENEKANEERSSVEKPAVTPTAATAA